MEETKLYQAAKKLFPDNYDVNYYVESLYKFPEGEWFEPTNREGEDFTMCRELADIHLVQLKITPNWVNDSFRGVRTQIMYKKDLKY